MEKSEFRKDVQRDIDHMVSRAERTNDIMFSEEVTGTWFEDEKKITINDLKVIISDLRQSVNTDLLTGSEKTACNCVLDSVERRARFQSK